MNGSKRRVGRPAQGLFRYCVDWRPDDIEEDNKVHVQSESHDNEKETESTENQEERQEDQDGEASP